MALTQSRLTLEEFLALPEAKPALEYADGEVMQKVSPKGQHSWLQYRFPEWFNRVTVSRQLAAAFPELRTTFAGRSYVPDVAVYRWERIPRDAHGKVADEFTEPPDIAIEIVSPDQSVTALIRKCLWYVAHGVTLALLVDPDDESVLRFRPDSPLQVLQGADVIDFGEVIPDLRLTVDEVFAMLVL